MEESLEFDEDDDEDDIKVVGHWVGGGRTSDRDSGLGTRISELGNHEPGIRNQISNIKNQKDTAQHKDERKWKKGTTEKRCNDHENKEFGVETQEAQSTYICAR